MDGILMCRSYSIAKAAEILGIGKTKCRQLIKSGELTAFDVGGKFCIQETELQRFIDERLVSRKEKK